MDTINDLREWAQSILEDYNLCQARVVMVQFKVLKIRLLGDNQTSFNSGNFKFKTLLNLYVLGPVLHGGQGPWTSVESTRLKDALVIFGTVVNEPIPFRKELTGSGSTCLSIPLLQTWINLTKGFPLPGFFIPQKCVLKEWRGFLYSMLLCAELKPINILSQLGTNRVCLHPDARARASQRWSSRRENPVCFS